MKSACWFALGCSIVLAPALSLRSAAADIPGTAGNVIYDFSLIPRPFRKAPPVNMTAETEMTEEGKRWPVPTPEHPVYYYPLTGQFRHIGDGPEERKPIEAATVKRVLVRALASAGYRTPERPGQPVSVVILFHWGDHTRLDPEIATPLDQSRNLVERAELVGGRKFAEKFAEVRNQVDQEAEIAELTGFNLSRLMPMTAPIFRWTGGDSRLEHLVAQTQHDVYFVIASAYDAAAMAKGKRVLLWRTKMTGETNGVSMLDVIPSLVSVSSPYFGRDMPDAEALRRRVFRGGRVEYGEPKVLGYDMPGGGVSTPDPAPAAPPAQK